jgi:hypothetical protein
MMTDFEQTLLKVDSKGAGFANSLREKAMYNLNFHMYVKNVNEVIWGHHFLIESIGESAKGGWQWIHVSCWIIFIFANIYP